VVEARKNFKEAETKTREAAATAVAVEADDFEVMR
jgi:hypothetical protein